MTAAPPAVFLLQSKLREDDRVVFLDRDDWRALMHWQIDPAANPRPTSLNAHWEGDPAGRRSRFPSYMLQAAIFTAADAAVLAGELTGGSLIPLRTDDDGPVETGAYLLHLVETVADCLDEAASSEPQEFTGYRRQVAFHADRLPDTAAFRIPQAPTVVYWNRGAAERIQALVGADAEAWPVWSLDPALPPHPNPMATRM